MNSDLQRRFDLEMVNIYRRAKYEAGYTATRYFQMLNDHGGLETAKILINSPTVSEGYTALYMRGRLDLTIEAMIFDNPDWQPLFSKEELNIVSKRLIEYQYGPAVGVD